MSKTTKELMCRVRRKLTRVIRLYVCSCGHESELRRAADARWGLEMMIEGEVERLVEELSRTHSGNGGGE